MCPPPAAPVSCSSDGYVSSDAFGYRLRASLRYAKVTDGIDLIPSVLFGQDVSGWSGDGLILQGPHVRRRFAAGQFRQPLRPRPLSMGRPPRPGGTYNNMRDRKHAQADVGFQFWTAHPGAPVADEVRSTSAWRCLRPVWDGRQCSISPD